MATDQPSTAPEWHPVPGGGTVEERGENYAGAFPALYECPMCAAAVPRGKVEKHAEWHSRLRAQTGPLGGFAGIFGQSV